MVLQEEWSGSAKMRSVSRVKDSAEPSRHTCPLAEPLLLQTSVNSRQTCPLAEPLLLPRSVNLRHTSPLAEPLDEFSNQ